MKRRGSVLICADLPDAAFRAVKVAAAQRGITVKQLINDAINVRLPAQFSRRRRFPVLDSKEPDVLRLTNSGIEELLA